ncbi:hypothetical protein SMA60_26290, partial [Escherichia coli]
REDVGHASAFQLKPLNCIGDLARVEVVPLLRRLLAQDHHPRNDDGCQDDDHSNNRQNLDYGEPTLSGPVHTLF